MLKERARLVASSFWLADLALIAGVFVLSHWVRADLLVARGHAPPTYPLAEYLPLLPVILLVWGIFLARGGFFRSHRTTTLAAETWELVRLSVLAAVAFTVCLFALRLDEFLMSGARVSRLWLGIFFGLALAALLVFRSLVRLTSRWIRERGLNFRTVLIVGTNPTALRIAGSIERHRSWGLRLAGFVRNDSAQGPEAVDPKAVIGTVEELASIVKKSVIDEVIIAVRRHELDRMRDLMLMLEEQGVCTRLALDLFPDMRARVELGELEGVPLLTFHTAPSSPFLLFWKRLIDIAVSATLLVLSAPLLVGIALAVRLGSPGPMIFRQTRCGLNGRRFVFYKFRTMVAGADESQPRLAHLNEMGGPVFKMRNDPRVTPVGRWLRKFSLDELPQLWNVLKGDMSLVGPRPPLPDEVDNYQRWQRRRLSMRPGLTCLWQIAGRNDIDFDRWMELDLQYIDSWSPSLDLKILARTIPAVLSGRGAS